jgi:hypothetical protein
VRGQQALVLQVHGFQHGGFAFVLVVEVFQGGKVIFGPQQLLALDAQGSGDQQGLVGDPFVQVQQLVQLAGGQEVPILDGATDGFDIGVVLDELFSVSGFMRRSTRPMRCIRRTGFQCRS